MTDEDFETIYAIALEAPERIGVWISSTPTGRRGKFWAACFEGNTQVLMADGSFKEIKDISEGDMVIGSTGEKEEVLTKMITHTDESLVRFRTAHMPWHTTTTKEHEILTIDGWKQAGHLTTEEYIQVVIPEYSKEDKTEISYDYSEIENRRASIAKCNKTVSEICKEYDVDRKTVWRIKKRYEEYGPLGLFDDRKRKNYIGAQSIIENKIHTSKFARLAGYYLAEGNIISDGKHKKGIMLTFNINEKEYIDEVRELLMEIFNLKSSVYLRPDNNQAAISCYSTELAYAFDALFGQKEDKRIPVEIMAGDHSMHLVDTLLLGDGYLRENGRYRLELSAKKVCMQVSHILMRNKIPVSIHYKSLENRRDTLTVDILSDKTNSYIFKNGNYYVKVNSIEWTEEEDVVVYNFETSKTHTYNANLLCVHNCQPGSGWEEFYYPTMVNPEWSPRMERELRSMYSEQGYVHEVLAEFGDETVGVFKKAHIDRARREYPYVQIPNYSAIRAVGVDWDKLFVPVKWCELLETPKAA